jgi:hypothetical protein
MNDYLSRPETTAILLSRSMKHLSATPRPDTPYAVVKKEAREKGTLLEIGAVWPHRNGKG